MEIRGEYLSKRTEARLKIRPWYRIKVQHAIDEAASPYHLKSNQVHEWGKTGIKRPNAPRS